MQYLIHAYDFMDEKALERRLATRSLHLEEAKKFRETGNYIVGGAILNDAGQMVGSVMVFEFATKDELQQWYDHEPYIIHQVWEKITISPFKIAQF